MFYRAVGVGLCLYASVASAKTIHVAPPPRGSDQVSCEAAAQAATPRQSLNGGAACLAPGDTLQVAAGTYDELIVGSADGTDTYVPRALRDLQPGTHVIPNGKDPTAQAPAHPTIVKAVGGQVIVSPRGKSYPDGGGILTAVQARHLVFDGVRFLQAAEPGSGSGVFLGNSAHIVLKNGKVDRGAVKSSPGSSFLTVQNMEITRSGEGCDFREGLPNGQPCPHGIYICGTDHKILRNYVHHNGYYGIQLSCEQGPVKRAELRENLVTHNPGVGIFVKCSEDCVIGSNVLWQNGRGIGVWGHNLIVNNTMVGYDARVDEPWAMTIDQGSGLIANNLVYGLPDARYYMTAKPPGTPVPPSMVRHNMCDVAGNPGCALVAPPAQVFQQMEHGDFRLREGSPAIAAGMDVPEVVQDREGTAFGSPRAIGAFASEGAPSSPTRVMQEVCAVFNGGAPVCVSTAVVPGEPLRPRFVVTPAP